jgi:hypothetical protein
MYLARAVEMKKIEDYDALLEQIKSACNNWREPEKNPYYIWLQTHPNGIFSEFLQQLIDDFYQSNT